MPGRCARPILLLLVTGLVAPVHGYETILPDAADAIDRAAHAVGGGWGTHLRRLTVQAVVSSPDFDGPSVTHYLYTGLDLDRPENGEFEIPAAMAGGEAP